MGGFSVYGLGILLTLEDKVSDKIGGVSNSLQNLSTKAMSLNYMGKSLMNTGKALLTPVVGLSKEVVRVSNDAEKARITLGALYGSAEAGAKKYNEIVEYATKTPFEINELRDASLQFKTLGIELIGTGSEVTSTSGKTRQFMEILGDMGAGLSGVARNGFKDVTYAVREFVTEGNKLSFLRRLGVDIDAVLTKAGKKVGNTVEERLKNMADLAEILRFYDPATGEGLTSKMFGTWSQVVSNMDDLWAMFCLGIGDTAVGIFENDEFGNTVFAGFKRTLDKVQQVLTKMNLGSFGEAIGKGLYSIMQPLDVIASKLVDVVGFVIDLVSQHPNIAKYALLLPTIAGALFLISGAALVAKSSMMVFGYGLGVVISMIPKALLLAGLFAVIKTSWDKDIGGIRTRLTGFVNTVNTSFSKAKEILAMSSEDMTKTYNDLVLKFSETGDFGAGLTAGIIRTAKLWGAFVDFWNDSKLSQENLKILQDMGLMPIFEKIAMWTSRFKAFFKGVTEGFSEMVNSIGDTVKNLLSKFMPSLNTGKGQGLFSMITGEFNSGDMSDIQNMGKIAMKLLPTALGLIKIAKLIHKHSQTGSRGGGLSGLLGRILGGNNSGSRRGGNFITTLRRLGNIPVKAVSKGIFNLGIILAGIAGVATVIGGIANLVGIETLGKGVIGLGALSLAMLPLGTPAFRMLMTNLENLSKMRVKDVGKGILNLGIIMIGLSAISAIALSIMALPLKNMSVGTMYALVGVLGLMGIIGYALTKFSDSISGVSTTKVLAGLRNMAIMLGGMAVIYMALGAISLLPFDVGRVAQISLVLGLLGAVGYALLQMEKKVNRLKPTSILKGLRNMAIMLGGVAALYMVLGAVSLIPFDIGRVFQLTLLIGVIGLVGAGLAGLAGLIGNIPLNVLVKGMAGIAIAIGVMAGIIAAFGALSRIDGFDELISDGGKSLSNLFFQIGNVVGSLVSGLGVGLTSGLPQIGSNIAGFVANLNPLFSMAKDENSSKIGEFFKSLGSGLLELTKSDFLSMFTGGTDWGKLATDLCGFAEDMLPFFQKVSTFPEDGLAKGEQFFKSLSNISKIPNSGGIAQWFSGLNDFEGTADGLNKLAETKPFFDFVAGLDEQCFINAPKFFEAIDGISSLPNAGGWAQKLTGLNDFGGVTEGLNSLVATKPFFDMVAQIEDHAFTNAQRYFTALDGISELPNVGGLASMFGENDFTGTTDGLIALSTTKSFFDMCSQISDTAFTNAVKLFDTLKDLKAPSKNKFKDLGDIATKLQTFSSKVSGFFKDVTSLNVDNIPKMVDGITRIQELTGLNFDNLGTIGTNISDFVTNLGTALSDIAGADVSGLNVVAQSLQDFFNTINSVVAVGISNVGTSIQSLVGSLYSVGSYIYILGYSFMELGSYAITSGGLVITACGMIITGMAMLTSVSTSSVVLIIYSFTQLGQGVLNSALVVTAGMMLMYAGVQSGCNLIIAAIASMCSTVRSQLASLASSGYSYGSQLSSSIAAGISANSGAIRAAVQSAISSAVASATINIPSVKVGHNALGTSNWAGGLTEINERGGEIVDLPRGTRIYPHDDSVTMAFDEGMRTAIDSMRGNSNDNRQYDNSVYFSAGSIVVQVASASEAEAERFAELVMKKIENKKRRKAIATYAY